MHISLDRGIGDDRLVGAKEDACKKARSKLGKSGRNLKKHAVLDKLKTKDGGCWSSKYLKIQVVTFGILIWPFGDMISKIEASLAWRLAYTRMGGLPGKWFQNISGVAFTATGTQ